MCVKDLNSHLNSSDKRTITKYKKIIILKNNYIIIHKIDVYYV